MFNFLGMGNGTLTFAIFWSCLWSKRPNIYLLFCIFWLTVYHMKILPVLCTSAARCLSFVVQTSSPRGSILINRLFGGRAILISPMARIRVWFMNMLHGTCEEEREGEIDVSCRVRGRFRWETRCWRLENEPRRAVNEMLWNLWQFLLNMYLLMERLLKRNQSFIETLLENIYM